MWTCWPRRKKRAPIRGALDSMVLSPQGENALMIQFFEWDWDSSASIDGSWWSYFESKVPYLAELGINQVWLPPMHKAMVPTGQGYDAYDLWDLGEFDQKGSVATRWGTKEELLSATRAAKERGISIIIDAVLNHKTGADRYEHVLAIPVNPQNRLEDLEPERIIGAWTAYDFPGRGTTHSAFKWSSEHFTGIDWDGIAKKNGVYRFVKKNGVGWNTNVSDELGNYDYLLGADIDHRHPDVRQDLLNWGTWILEETGSIGYRIDACKHYDYTFMCDFVRNARKSPEHSRLFSVAEFWSGEIDILLNYMKNIDAPISFFDVPLHYNFHRASKAGSTFDLRTILDGSLVSVKPRDAVTFVENHDTVLGQSLESPVNPEFKAIAYALILLRPYGHPCVYHPDILSPAFSIPLLDRLILARQLFAYGPCRDSIKESKDAQCIAFVRDGDGKEKKGCVVLLSIAEDDGSQKKVDLLIGRAHAGSRWQDYLRQKDGSGSDGVVVGKDGRAVFPYIQGVQVFVRD